MTTPLLPGNGIHRPSPRAPKKLRLRDQIPWLPYVAPLVIFLVLTTMESSFKDAYPVYYTAKVALVGYVVYAFRRFLPEIKPERTGLVLAIPLGAVLFVLWIVVDRFTPHFPGIFPNRISYQPDQHIHNTALLALFYLIRFFGLVVLVPIIEETFYRGFLLRYVTDPDDFRRVPLGRFNMAAFVTCVLMMAASHPEWLAAAVFSAALCALIARTRSLFACIVAHGTTNLLLGLYVVIFHQWQYW